MTAQATLKQFFDGFGITAYKNTAVPSDVTYPYLTYEEKVGFLGDMPQACTVNLWYYTESEAIPNAKVREIEAAIGRGGVTLPFDGGFIWVQRGSPWCQSLTDDNDHTVKRRYINVNLQYFQ